jgi:hypothetical protein
MPFVLLPDKVFDVEWLALASVERADALINLGPEPAQLLDVRQQLLTDLFLIGVRQTRYFGDSLLKRFDHVAPY